jgi:hypothetical protein
MPQSPTVQSQDTPEFELPRSIAIEGPIRVGKSTLSRILADRLHARRVFDPEDNPFLTDFYKEKPGSAFRAQMYFLFERHQRLLEAQMNDAAPLVSDFLFEKDKIFAYVNLDNEELKVYERYFGMFAAALNRRTLSSTCRLLRKFYATALQRKNLPPKIKFPAPTSRKSYARMNISSFIIPHRIFW